MEESVNVTNITVLSENIFELEKVSFRVWIDLDLKLLMYTEWILKPSAEEYREACVLFIKLVKEHAVESWIAESKRLTGLPAQVQLPVIYKFAPALAGSSLKKLARIIDNDSESLFMFENISINLKEKYKSVIEVE